MKKQSKYTKTQMIDLLKKGRYWETIQILKEDGFEISPNLKNLEETEGYLEDSVNAKKEITQQQAIKMFENQDKYAIELVGFVMENYK